MRKRNKFNRHLYNAYDLDLKKSVVIFAEQNGNKEAQARYGISEANIRRWRRLKHDIFGKPLDYDRGNLRTRKRVNYNYKIEKVNCDYLDQESQSSVDSMPLQERLSKVAAQEKIASSSSGNVLKSQPLSPTKLKVTRQSPKVPAKPVEPPQSPVNEEMCLRWNSHHSNMQTAFPSILLKEQYVDVTLAAEGKTLKCHRLILSSCSPYFEEILSGISPFQHPVLFMRDIPFWILKSLCDFMYAGEVHIFQNKLEELLTVAEALKIKGLAGKSTPPENHEEPPNNKQETNHANTKEVKKKQHQQQHHHHQQQQQQQHQQQQQQLQQQQEKEKEKAQPHPPPLKKNPVFTPSNNFESTSHDYDNDDLLDPLDLLEPLYEEAAEEKKPSGVIIKPKENKYIYQPIKKTFTRKLRKRKYSEQRDPSPPPVFSFRKGTRSRPNVKIPKYYHSDYSNLAKPAPNSQTDPLLDVEEIKTEPIDVEDNLIDYSDEENQYMQNSIDPTNCDSPIIITSAKPSIPTQDKFKKIKLSKPIITEIHTIEETNTTSGGLEVIKITVQQPDDVVERNKKGENEGVVDDPLKSVATAENDAINETPTTASATITTINIENDIHTDGALAVDIADTEMGAEPGNLESTESAIETTVVTIESAEDAPDSAMETDEVVQIPDPAVQTPDRGVDTPDPLVESLDRGVDTPDPLVETLDRGVETPDPLVETPDGGIEISDRSVETPDHGVETPDCGVETPDRGVETPDRGVEIPDRGVETPDCGVETPDGAVETPDRGVETPDRDVDTPDRGVETPDRGVETPDRGVETPDRGVETPDRGVDTPDGSSTNNDKETGSEMANNNRINEDAPKIEEPPETNKEVEDVETISLEEMDQDMEEERRTTSLDHLEKEAMNVANAINMENQAGSPDIE